MFWVPLRPVVESCFWFRKTQSQTKTQELRNRTCRFGQKPFGVNPRCFPPGERSWSPWAWWEWKQKALYVYLERIEIIEVARSGGQTFAFIAYLRNRICAHAYAQSSLENCRIWAVPRVEANVQENPDMAKDALGPCRAKGVGGSGFGWCRVIMTSTGTDQICQPIGTRVRGTSPGVWICISDIFF